MKKNGYKSLFIVKLMKPKQTLEYSTLRTSSLFILNFFFKKIKITSYIINVKRNGYHGSNIYFGKSK
jgi:hypothetical protein